ncbi:MAG: alpha/beta fold hydrolase [Holosporaceae bacterium]|jgi:polyhydroxyalkanoate synthase|nr:alpha/beta fold hydrolase [Holosporaceae bacterium]
MANPLDDNFNFASKSMELLFQLAVTDPKIAFLPYLKIAEKMASRPEKIKKSREDLFDRLAELQKSFADTWFDSVRKHSETDDDFFDNNPAIIFVRKFHETVSEWMMNLIDEADGLDPFSLNSAKFFTKQYIHMTSPDNFPFLNPKVIKEALNTGGENFIKGMGLLLEDIKNGAVSTNDRTPFEVGKNLAVTPGKVVFQNDIIELIMYSPSTPKVFATPLLFISPWINKFYILDLNPEYSFVRWAVDNGFTVFMISWVNPDAGYRNKGLDDYVADGLAASLNKIADLTKTKSVHAVGYCVGGTILSAYMAYTASPHCRHRPKTNIVSATLLTTPLDFEHAGDMVAFITEGYLEAVSVYSKAKGFLSGNILYNTFNALRSKDMIWRYVIDSYMLGKKPQAHEILFWNSDPVNLSESMLHSLAKDLYRDNMLKKGLLKILGVPVNMSLVKTPVYMISMERDHLVPWQATFDGIKLFSGTVRFVLGGSGHVAGVINHPALNKYWYRVNQRNIETAREWFDTAEKIVGSWWNDWLDWIKPAAGPLIDPPEVSDFIRDAPGIYVKNQLPQPDRQLRPSSETPGETTGPTG